MATISQLNAKLIELRGNPTAMQRLMIATVESVTNGEVIIVDPTNPFVFLMEAAVSVGSATMLQAETLTRKQYPSLANDEGDLYLHMSDKDYLNRFATPARTSFTLLLSLDEVKTRAVDMGGGVKKLTIPRHTEFLAADMVFTMQYPIDIHVMPHGGVSLRYDMSKPSPLMSLITNRVDWGVGSIRGSKFLRITIPVQQMLITTQMAQLNNITGFNKSFAFADQFYYARAFTKLSTASEWVEIKTTHTDQVYDANVATVALKVLNQELSIHVPQIYFNSGLIKDSLRLDIYTTKGAQDFSLANYAIGSFGARWYDHDLANDNVYSKELATFASIAIYSESTVTGGSHGVSFTDLRNQVINKALSNPEVPITTAQLSTNMASLGYDLVLYLDNVTDRQYLATRSLPPPSNGSSVTGAGCTIQTLQATMASLIGHPYAVINNANRVTIKPNALFQTHQGVYQLVSEAGLAALHAMPPETMAIAVNNGNYFYTPFYYVLDASQAEFEVRAYRLDKPKISSKFFWNENITLQIEAGTLDYVLLVNDSVPGGAGYVLVVEALASETWNGIALDQQMLQLSYIPPGTTTRIHLQGELVSELDATTGQPADGRYIYHFALNTNYDVDSDHQLILEPFGTGMALETEFDLVYIVKDHLPVGSVLSDIDTIVDAASIPDYDPAAVYRGVLQEKMTLKFGDHLQHLWTRSRSVVESTSFISYPSDVPAFYTQNIYQRDETGNIVLSYDALTETFSYTVLYAPGDPVMTPGGEVAWQAALAATPGLVFADWWVSLTTEAKAAYQALAHRAGEHILDTYGNPQPVNGVRGILRQIDMLFLDGKYYFATNESTTSYRDEVTDLITTWVTTDIDTISNRLLERTELFFYPKTTVGKLNAYVADGRLVQIDADQHFSVQYYLTQAKYDNAELRATLEHNTAEVLAASLLTATLSVSDMVSRLVTTMGDDILSVTVQSNVFGLSGDGVTRYPAITLKDQSMRPSIGKRLVALSNQTLVVQDSVAVEFIKHT